MRRLFLLLVITIPYLVAGNHQYQIIDKNDRQGLANGAGEELIPPIYDRIGWSRGEVELVGDIIGYKLNGGWGLITINNKVLTDPDFYHLSILDSAHIKAAIKGRFSNKLFFGLIDTEGETVVSCSYFDIEPLGSGFEISSYDHGSIKKGFLNDRYEVVIDADYTSVEYIDKSLLAAKNEDGKWSFYRDNMPSYVNHFDHFEVSAKGIIVRRNGMYGLLARNSSDFTYDVQYKDILWNDGWRVLDFPDWEISSLGLDSVKRVKGDSVALRDEIFITYLNGTQELLIDGTDIFGDRNVELVMAKSGYLITRDLDFGKWKLSKTNGRTIISDQDSISFDGLYFFALNEKKWDIYNRFGRKLSLKRYDEVKHSVANMIPVRRNEYWGLLDFQGRQSLSHKYDDIGEGTEKMIAVRYLGEWGVLDLFGDWVIPPRYDEIEFCENLIKANRGMSTTLFGYGGEEVFKGGVEIINMGTYLKVKESDTTFGILSGRGEMLLDPVYKTVGEIGGMYFGQLDGSFVLVDSVANNRVRPEDGIEKISGYSEGYFKIKKDGKWGFIDENGKLRIANRYTGSRLFSESYCAVRLNGGWGYVDKSEKLVVQPIYEETGDYDNGLAVVKYRGNYGILGIDGGWVVKPQFERIGHNRGSGYILVDQEQKVGVADRNGKFVLTPQYESVEEVGNGLLIVKRKGKMGIMDEKGYVRVPLNYKQIEVKGDYFVMKLD